MFKSATELCDVVSLVIYCAGDSTLLLTLEPNATEYWIPSSKITSGSSWHSQSQKDIDDILGLVITNQKLLRLYKISLDHNTNNIFHCVYCIQLSSDQKKRIKNNYGKYRGRNRWVQDSEIIKMLPQEIVRSPEILEFYNLSKANLEVNDIGDSSPPFEFTCCGNLTELSDGIQIQIATDGIYEQLVESAHFTKEVQGMLFKEFLVCCYPAMYMCQQAFYRIVMLLGWTRDECLHIFKAADLYNRYGLSYKDFVYVIAAMEPNTSHGGTPAEIRCRYMFRFFDRDNDLHLNFSEFKIFTTYIRKSKKQPVDPLSVTRDAEGVFKSLGLNMDTGMLGLVDFLKAVGELKLRGTSQVFRSTISIIQYLNDAQNRDSKLGKPNIKISSQMDSGKSFMKALTEGKVVPYELGEHVIRLQKSGTLMSIDQIWSIGGKKLFMAMGHVQRERCFAALNPHNMRTSKQAALNMGLSFRAVSPSSTRQPMISEQSRRLSQDQFNQTSMTNDILKSLRYLLPLNKGRTTVKNPKISKPDPYTWGQIDPNSFAKNFMTVCGQVKEIFKNEPRLLVIHSPVYILGDLHGNIVSLMYFEKVLWHLGVGLCPSNLLFLGDYVDRGPYSVEVISYLFSYKLQNPNKLFLIRGNHEIRDIQKMFTFYNECVNKFGDKTGSEIWSVINNTFDTMPIAASVDGKIFCCHGGIPPPWLCPNISSINSIPCPLPNPDEQSSLAWEIMWNDPISKTSKMNDDVNLELVSNDGFAANTRRGTAHVFSVEALERFLNTNGYSHLVRAHEVAQVGFNVLQRAKLLTVFSSSKYCGGVNEAACIFVDQGKIRVLRLEPS